MKILSIILILLSVAPVISAQSVEKEKTSQKTPSEQDYKELAETASRSRENLIATSQTYRESLEKLLILQKQEAERSEKVVEKNHKLLEMGLIARRELEDSEREFSDAKGKVEETENQLRSLDNLVAEVMLAEEAAKEQAASLQILHSSSLVIRFAGSSRWALGDLTKVDAFFRLKFSKPLPVSAYGQTETHSRLGFDHGNAIDVAVHPDTEEGRELVNFLAKEGISFIAIRGAIAGSATGAHIHIGPSSRRITGN